MPTVLFVPDIGISQSIAAQTFERFYGGLMSRDRRTDLKVLRCRWVDTDGSQIQPEGTLTIEECLSEYHVRGKVVRDSIRYQIESLTESAPVVLVAQSLGGIACIALLAEAALPQVKRVMTVGIPMPLLETRIVATLPASIPPWTNFYDPRDVLSSRGNPLFGSGIEDIEVDNGCGFPEAHSAYWDNPSVYQAIIDRLHGN